MIKEEGKSKYSKYLCQLFRAYKTSTNDAFTAAIAEEKRRWHQGRLYPNYDYGELLQLGHSNNDSNQEEGKPKLKRGPNKNKNANAKEEETKFLTLATSILQTIKDNGAHVSGGSSTGKGNKSAEALKGQNGRPLKPWRFKNPDGAATKEINGWG